MHSISIISYDIQFMENPDFKISLLRQYLQNLSKLDYPFAQLVSNYIIKKNLIDNLESFNSQFGRLSLIQISELFNTFPEIKPEFLIFITTEINGQLIYFNKAIYTQVLFENRKDDGSGYIDFMAFNKIVERVDLRHITSIDLSTEL